MTATTVGTVSLQEKASPVMGAPVRPLPDLEVDGRRTAGGATVTAPFKAPADGTPADGNGSPAVRSAAQLGIMVGDERLLVDLAEAGEILPLPPSIAPVPLTRDWFLGMTNVRGSLHTVVDLRRFSAGGLTEVGKESRLLSLAPSLGFNVTLIVSRMLGLRHTAAMTPMTDDSLAPTPAPWIGDAFADADGNIWRELSLSKLIAAPAFLMIGR